MGNDNKFATRVGLKPETEEELLKAVEFFREMEEDLDWSVEKSKYRLPNGKFDRDQVIRKVLKEFNKSGN